MYRIVLILLGMCSGSGIAFGCTQLPAGTSLWVRLSQPVSSYSAKPGMSVAGFLLESPTCEGVSVLPTHLPVEGRVVSVHRVGLGLIHETATLEIEFSRILPQQGPPIEIRGRVDEVDNARESVKNGVIHGIRSTETPQGEISSRLKYLPSLHLYPDPFLLGFKLLCPVFPEPEIYLPPGTDLLVGLKDNVDLLGEVAPASLPRLQNEEEQSVAEILGELPTRTLDKKSRDADLINLAFVGTRDELVQAFHKAGWKESDSVSRQSVERQLQAFLAKSSYATAPMSRQRFDGRPSDLNLEKTFDSYSKRDHLRIWKLESTVNDTTLWAAAAVRETGATLSFSRMRFMHHVLDDLDEEQRAIQRDLLAVGCIDSVGKVERPTMDKAMINATGEVLRTDGDVIVLRVKTCSGSFPDFNNASRFRPGSNFSRYLRKEILTVRSDLERANVIYLSVHLVVGATQGLRQISARRADIRSVHLAAARIPAGGKESLQPRVETQSALPYISTAR
jgi:LssY C-terminus